MAEFFKTDRWWEQPRGWEDYGIHTPMRRCGFCKADIVSDEYADRERGACGTCSKRAPKAQAKKPLQPTDYEPLIDEDEYDNAGGF